MRIARLMLRVLAAAVLACGCVYGQADREAVQTGDAHFRAGRFAAALAEYLRAKEIAAVLQESPVSTRVYIERRIISCRLLAEQINEARQELREASAAFGRDPAWTSYEHLVRAEIDLAAASYRDAVEGYTAAVADTRLAPAERVRATAGLAEAQIGAGDLIGAGRTIALLRDRVRDAGEPELRFLEGLLQLESGLIATALDTLRKGIKAAPAAQPGVQDPILSRLLFAEGAAWLRGGDLARATKSLQEGNGHCQSVPSVSEWGLRLQGEVALESGQPDPAAVSASMLLSANQIPDTALPRLHAALLRARVDALAKPAAAAQIFSDQAEKIRSSLGEAHPLTLRAMLLQAAAQLQSDRTAGQRSIARMLAAVDRAYAPEPGIRAFWRNQAGQVLEEFGLDTLALEQYSSASDVLRGKPQPNSEIALESAVGSLLTQEELGRWSAAESGASLLPPAANDALPMHSARHLLAAGIMDLRRGELDKAQSALQTARESAPRANRSLLARVDFRLAELAARHGKTDEAMKLFGASLPLMAPRPAVAAAWAERGRTMLKAARRDDADGAFRRAWRVTLDLPFNSAARTDAFVPLAAKSLLARRNNQAADDMLDSWFDWCEKNRARLPQESDADLQDLLTFLLDGKNYQRADRMLARAIPLTAASPTFDQLVTVAAETSEKAGNYGSAANYFESIAARYARRREAVLQQQALERAMANLDRTPGVSIQQRIRVRLLFLDSLIEEARRPANEGNTALLDKVRQHLGIVASLIAGQTLALEQAVGLRVDMAWADMLVGKSLDDVRSQLQRVESEAAQLPASSDATRLKVYYALGAAALRQNDTQGAASYFNKSLTFASTVGEEGLSAGMVDDIAFANYEKRSMPEQAETMFRSFLAVCRDTFGADSEELAEASIHYANFLDRHERYKEATAQVETANRIYASRLGESSAEVADSISLLARLQQKDNNPKRASELLSQALMIRRGSGRLKPVEEIRLLQELGRTQITANLYRDAAGTLGELAKLTEARDSANVSPETLTARIGQIAALIQSGQAGEGARVYQVMRTRLQKDRTRYVEFERSLIRGYADALEKTGKAADAKKLRAEADRLSVKR
jgi:hypothetical protein